jgi:L-threonylcarbamoyladenylate synthase
MEPRILRPGMISAEAMAAAIGSGHEPVSVSAGPSHGGALRSPGMLARHYSPRGRLLVLEWKDEVDLLSQLSERGVRPGPNVQILTHSRIPMGGHFAHVNIIPHDAEAFARGLYAELHRCDDEGADWIVVEAPPEAPDWQGIADRLRRASVSK